jgi:hypothetical protein
LRPGTPQALGIDAVRRGVDRPFHGLTRTASQHGGQWIVSPPQQRRSRAARPPTGSRVWAAVKADGSGIGSARQSRDPGPSCDADQGRALRPRDWRFFGTGVLGPELWGWRLGGPRPAPKQDC